MVSIPNTIPQYVLQHLVSSIYEDLQHPRHPAGQDAPPFYHVLWRIVYLTPTKADDINTELFYYPT